MKCTILSILCLLLITNYYYYSFKWNNTDSIIAEKEPITNKRAPLFELGVIRHEAELHKGGGGGGGGDGISFS